MRALWIFGLGMVLTGCLDKFPEAPDVDGDGFTVADGDCDDDDALLTPDTTWYADTDGDGFGDPEGTLVQCELPAGYVAVTGDCDDADPDVNPSAIEVCDDVDEDCDGVVDDGTSGGTYYADVDADGFGDLAAMVTSCTQPADHVTDATDCDDTDEAVNPDAIEVCNDIDDDCDGAIDVGATDAPTWYADADNDGYGDDDATTVECDAPSGTVDVGGDCDDTDDAFHPDAEETDCTDPNDYNCDGSSGFEDGDSDGFAACADCDDSDPLVSPSGAEACNGYDDDCDSSIDEGAAVGSPTWYFDGDGDGYGNDDRTAVQCDAPSNHVALGGDCDDGDKDFKPGAPETDCTDPNDYDCDGVTLYADEDADGFPECTECDDEDASANPDETEVCDSVDNDCDGTVDEADAADAPTWYGDGDGDGFGDATDTRVQCTAPTGYVAFAGDCDDGNVAYNPDALEADCADPNDYNCDGTVGYTDGDGDGFAACEECDDTEAAINPDADELCDGADNDCDGSIDEASAIDAPTWYVDADRDSYGDAAVTTVQCAKPVGYVSGSTDCDDTSDSINPGVSEVCDTSNTDEDCDGNADDADTGTVVGEITTYIDADADGYGSDTDAGTGFCELPSGRVTNDGDCDDADNTVNPSAPEVCDPANTDEDCDTKADDADTAASGKTSWYADLDGDGFGDGTATSSCDQPTGRVGDGTDCDDVDEFAYPGAPETCDTIDNDCDTSIDEHTWALDFDGVDDIVTLPTLPTSTAWTMEAWVLGVPTNVTNEALFGTKCGELQWSATGFGVVLYDACSGTGAVHQDTAVLYATWPTGWWHVALVATSSTTASVYVDGTSVGSIALSADTVSTTHSGGLGGTYSTVDSLWTDVTMGSARISDTARYTAAFTPDVDLSVDGDTVARYGLDEGADVTAGDDAAAYDGTIFGATWLNDGPECP